AAATSTAAGLSWSCLWGWARGVWFAHSGRGRLKRCPFGAELEVRIHLAPPVSPMRNYFLESGRAWFGQMRRHKRCRLILGWFSCRQVILQPGPATPRGEGEAKYAGT